MSEQKKLGILVGGGPAPGLNGIISSVTIAAINQGLKVYGIFDGYKWLEQGDSSHVEELTIEKVSRLHLEGGTYLRTARANPTVSQDKLDNCVKALKDLDLDFVVTTGGDDTSFSATKIAETANAEIRFAHCPKTIDNDLPLPEDAPTFGFETARHLGARLVTNLMEDARSTNRWYFVIAMGRKAGHLALGMGKAAGATITVLAEEFPGKNISVKQVCDVLEGAIIKRRAMGQESGVAVLAEGLAERFTEEELKMIPGMALEYDEYGHIRLAEVELGKILKRELERRFAERGEKFKSVELNIGYELRCADPIPYDQDYTRNLGCLAVEFLLDPEYASIPAAMICVEDGKLKPMQFKELIDPATKKVKVRMVDLEGINYKVSQQYMIKLVKKDFDNAELLAKMATIAQLTPEDFKEKFENVVS